MLLECDVPYVVCRMFLFELLLRSRVCSGRDAVLFGNVLNANVSICFFAVRWVLELLIDLFCVIT
jgi:hypothetical protein